MTIEQAMHQAIKLSLKGCGFVSPNPRVGALILKDDEVIAQGWHKKFGGPHAEVEAIKNAGDISLEGATMVVNLEPCSHEGKTPPCAPRLIEKKFARVIIGMKDPNPMVAGRGIEMLKDAGIEVIEGVLEEECKWVNRAFIKHIATGMPYVTAKIAQSLDGKIASSTGDSKWITCEESRKRAHKLRSEVDAIVIGRKTAVQDNPKLTVRHVKGKNPARIVLDSGLSLPFNLNLFNDPLRKHTYVCCKPEALTNSKANNLKLAGIKVIPAEMNGEKMDLAATMKKFSEELNLASIMIEGGAGIFSAFADNNLIDEYHFFIAPKIVGEGLSSFANIKSLFISDSTEVKIINTAPSGVDVHLIAIRK